MVWTAPMTATPNTAFTAAQFNTHIRDNLLETAPAKATAVGSLFAVSATNQIQQRTPTGSTVGTTQTTTSTTYTDLTTVGPSVSVQTGVSAVVFLSAQMSNSTAAASSLMSYAVSGATVIAAVDDTSILTVSTAANAPSRSGVIQLQTGLNPGVNVFTAKYRAASNTGSYKYRHLAVIPL